MTMLNNRFIQQLAEQLHTLLPSRLIRTKEDLVNYLQQAMQGALAKLNLVTREEFDVQVKLLARTQAKVEALEASITALEQQLNSHNKVL
jgi:hypothetical protein